MKRINILPKEIALEYKYRSRWIYLIRRYFLRLVLAILIVEIFLFASLHGIRALKINVEKRNFKKVKEEINLLLVKKNNQEEEMARIKRDIERVDKKIDEAQEKLSFLNQIRRKPKDHSDILAEISTESPRKIWITHLEVEKDKLKIIGGSYNTLLVAEFMNNLQQSPFFANADFTYTKKGEVEKVVVVEFEITCNVVRGHKSL